MRHSKVLTSPILLPDKESPNTAVLIGLYDRERKNRSSRMLERGKGRWDSFVLQYSGLIYHTINRTLALHHTEPKSELVEDLYQEFFLAILRDDCKKLRQFKGDRGCSLATWLKVQLFLHRTTSFTLPRTRS